MKEIAINLVSDLVSITLFAIFWAVVYLWFFWRRKKSCLHFFGVQNEPPNICIYLSRLAVKPGGTTSLESTKSGYSGLAIVKPEYDGALLIQEQLQSKILAFLPKTLQEWLGQSSAILKILNVSIKISPSLPLQNGIFSNNLLILGTGVYNSLAQYYLKDFLPHHRNRYFFYEKNSEGERVIGIRQKGLEDTLIKGRSYGNEIAFIQRINDDFTQKDFEITVFICAGLGSSATYGSVRYLAENWRDLQRKFKDKEFGICLSFPNQASDDEFVRPAEVIQTFLAEKN